MKLPLFEERGEDQNKKNEKLNVQQKVMKEI